MLEPRVGGRQRPLEPVYSHSRSRTSSSNVFPANPQPYQQTPTMQVHLAAQPAHQYHPTMSSRRSPSVNTFNSALSSSSSTMVPPAAYRTSPTMTDLHRTASNRSGGAASAQYSGSSYVALLRKQKATVWSDRAQPEDPRLAATQRAAKMRAAMEMNGGRGLDADGIPYGSGGGQGSGRTATGLSSVGGKVGAKIRHHGKPGIVGYTSDTNYAAGVGGVPLRLSATEVEGGDSDEEDNAAILQRNMAAHHRRTGSSGRSSTASGRARHQQAASQGGGLAYRTSGRHGSMSSAVGRRWSPNDTPERSGSLVDHEASRMSTMASAADETRSFASGSSAERADAVPDLAAQNRAKNSAQNAALTREKSVKTVDELKRRGSVDERTMTLTGAAGRLFIANPD